jgi:hypothetical protein
MRVRTSSFALVDMARSVVAEDMRRRVVGDANPFLI